MHKNEIQEKPMQTMKKKKVKTKMVSSEKKGNSERLRTNAESETKQGNNMQNLHTN